MSKYLPNPHRFSRSMKRATVSFTIPGRGRTTVQENADCVDEQLRRAIVAAKKSFDRIWLKKS